MADEWEGFDFSTAVVGDIGGLDAFFKAGKIVHWNINVPGDWVGLHTLESIGSYVASFCNDEPGVYRLIALDEAGKPAKLNRLRGFDRTGTLYIGAEGKTFASRSRLGQLVRSLRQPRYGYVYNDEHKAGRRLRSHPELNAQFPNTKLALNWCYCRTPLDAERALFEVYFASFGDTPPLNFRM